MISKQINIYMIQTNFNFVIQTLLFFWLIRCSRWLALKICQIISLWNSTSLNNVNCCSVNFVSKNIQGRKDFIFEPFDKSIFTLCNEKPSKPILDISWSRHFSLLNFSNLSRLPVNIILWRVRTIVFAGNRNWLENWFDDFGLQQMKIWELSLEKMI